MRRAALLPLLCGLACAAAALSGCWNGRVLYALEPPFVATLGDETTLRLSLDSTALRHGYAPSFSVDVGQDPAGLLAREARRGYAAVVVGPLLSFQWQQFVLAAPRTRFILVDVPPPPAGAPTNTVFLTFDRTAAFQEAGRLAARSVRAAAEAGAAGFDLAARIGVLAADGSGLLPAEAEAFESGAAGLLDGARPANRTLPALPDAEAVRAAVTQMRADGVQVFLLGLGERDAVGLEALRDAGASAVVSDWQKSAPLPAQVLATVEEDVEGGISLALSIAPPSGAGSRVVQGPVRLVEGPAGLQKGRKI